MSLFLLLGCFKRRNINVVKEIAEITPNIIFTIRNCPENKEKSSGIFYVFIQKGLLST